MFSIYKKEIRSYFNSPLAYVLFGMYIFIFSFFFLGLLLNPRGSSQFVMGGYLYQVGILLTFILPIITMKAFAEERKNGTEVLLMTSPVSVAGMVLGKYLAALTVFFVMTLLTLIYPIITINTGNLNVMPTVSSYIGHFLMGAVFVAYGIFTSSLTHNQIIAALLGVAGLFGIWFVDFLSGMFRGSLRSFANWISFFYRFRDFVQGILNSKDLVFFLSLIGLFLLLSMIVIEKRRWSQG
ncbi:UNVERIFIED_CONTAM: ABC-2 type transport system permease protein [Acetivibrio alkalicellulosi]